jgi:hypothetical protein
MNTLFSLYHKEKKDISDADQLWGIRNLTGFRRPALYCSFPQVDLVGYPNNGSKGRSLCPQRTIDKDS